MGDKPNTSESARAALAELDGRPITTSILTTPWCCISFDDIPKPLAEKMDAMVKKTKPDRREPYDMRHKATREGMKAMDAVYKALEADWSKAPPGDKRDYRDLLKGVT